MESEVEHMKKTKNILWGLLLIVVGVIWGLNELDITDINIFFDGWWTLIIIVPCAIGLFSEPDKTGNLIGLGIGVVLLLTCQDILDLDLVWKLMIPVIIVIIGIRLIFKDAFDRKMKVVVDKMKMNGTQLKQYCATFSGQNVNLAGERFEGAELTAVFGGVECDLTQAIIEEDVVIQISSIFGGVDLFLPTNVNVKISSTSIFGGISDKRAVKTTNNQVTVYINATCMFGGVDIK